MERHINNQRGLERVSLLARIMAKAATFRTLRLQLGIRIALE